MPGLPDSRSQLAVPDRRGQRADRDPLRRGRARSALRIRRRGRARGGRGAAGPTMRSMQELAESAAEPSAAGDGAAPTQGPPVTIRHYAADDSVFVGDDYLIKGVAGAIFWKLLRDYARERPHRVHQSRAAARPVDPAARPFRQPGGAAHPAATAPRRARALSRAREDRARPLSPLRPPAGSPRRGGGRTAAESNATGSRACGIA